MRYNPPKNAYNIAFKHITDKLTLQQINSIRKALSHVRHSNYHNTKIDWSLWYYSIQQDALIYEEEPGIPLIKVYLHIAIFTTVKEI